MSQTLIFHAIVCRGVPDQDFQNPARNRFTGLFHEIRPDNLVSFCRIIRPEPDFYISKFFYCSAKIMRSDKDENIASLNRHLTVLHAPAAKNHNHNHKLIYSWFVSS